jgi:hypothetical protein
MHRQARVLAVLALSVLVLAASCDKDDEPIAPSSDVHELVTRSCHIWLNARMMDADWAIFSAPDATWRYALTVDGINQWFQANMDPPELWIFNDLLAEVSQSELYRKDPPNPYTLVAWVKAAFNSFEYVPEEE